MKPQDTTTISASELAEIAQALSNERKAGILLMLLDQSLSAKEISEQTGYPYSNVNTALHALHDCGLVSATHVSYSTVYQGTEKARRLVRALVG